MQTYELLVSGRAVRANSADTTLVRTSIGIDQIHVMFDSEEWLDFPLTVTFAQSGVEPVTQSLTVTEIEDSDEWVSEATVTIPYEVITMVGPIRITFQGTDSDGRHIITAKGAPLSVEEAGDVDEGVMPSDAPTQDQWTQAYSDAMVAVNEAASIVNSITASIDSILSNARLSLSALVEESYVPATSASLGVIKVGDGLGVTEDGTLSATATGLSNSQIMQLANIASLAYYCFDTSFDEDGYLDSGATVKPSAIPLASLVDGTTIRVNDDGVLELAYEGTDETEY